MPFYHLALGAFPKYMWRGRGQGCGAHARVCLDPAVTEQFKFNRISNLPLEIGAVFLGKEEEI